MIVFLDSSVWALHFVAYLVCISFAQVMYIPLQSGIEVISSVMSTLMSRKSDRGVCKSLDENGAIDCEM